MCHLVSIGKSRHMFFVSDLVCAFELCSRV